MRISKIIVALLVSVVAITAMTGVAVANPSTTVAPSSATVDVPTNTPTQLQVVYTVAASLTGEKLPDGICVDIKRDVPSPDVLHTDEINASWDGLIYNRTLECTNDVPTPVLVDSGTNLSWTWTCWIKDAKDTDDSTQMNHHYNAQFAVINGTVPVQGGTVTLDVIAGADNTPIDPIPEFATIAIPAIAVLGLFLFFNKRKHKKD